MQTRLNRRCSTICDMYQKLICWLNYFVKSASLNTLSMCIRLISVVDDDIAPNATILHRILCHYSSPEFLMYAGSNIYMMRQQKKKVFERNDKFILRHQY